MGLEGRSVGRSVVEFRCGLVWIYKRDVDVVVGGWTARLVPGFCVYWEL